MIMFMHSALLPAFFTCISAQFAGVRAVFTLHGQQLCGHAAKNSALSIKAYAVREMLSVRLLQAPGGAPFAGGQAGQTGRNATLIHI